MRHKLEHFAKVQWIVASDLDRPSYKQNDRRFPGRWLNIQGLDDMLDLADALKLVHDRLLPSNLRAFECHH